MHRTIFILSLLFLILPAKAQPKHVVRAAWITGVYGLDGPRTRAPTPQGVDGDYSARQQKARRFSRQTICHQASERYMRAL